MSKIWKSLVTVIYAIGVVLVIALSCTVVTQSHVVVSPDAMLPVELWELATLWLTAGSVPMLIFSALFYKVHDISNSAHKARDTFLIYSPAVICLLWAAVWLSVWVIGMFNTFSKT